MQSRPIRGCQKKKYRHVALPIENLRDLRYI